MKLKLQKELIEKTLNEEGVFSINSFCNFSFIFLILLFVVMRK